MLRRQSSAGALERSSKRYFIIPAVSRVRRAQLLRLSIAGCFCAAHARLRRSSICDAGSIKCQNAPHRTMHCMLDAKNNSTAGYRGR